MTQAPTAIVPDEGLEARRLPDESAEVVARIHPSVEVIVLEHRGSWALVGFPDGGGRELWVEADSLQTPAARGAA
jgi:hypothetical protein